MDDDELKYVEAIIRSMTKQERRKPKVLNGSRRKRIAAGSGTAVQDVNRLIKDFDKSRKMMKQMMKGGKGKGRKRAAAGMPTFPEMR
jgi:signal recognition particle subunit SRP54